MNSSGLVLLLLFLGVEIALTNYFARRQRARTTPTTNGDSR